MQDPSISTRGSKKLGNTMRATPRNLNSWCPKGSDSADGAGRERVRNAQKAFVETDDGRRAHLRHGPCREASQASRL